MSHDDKEQLVKALLDTNPFTSPEAAARTMERAANALLDMPSARAINLRDEDVEWVVNDIAELGVKIGNQFFWLYKGHSLVYGTEDDPERKDGICLHDNGKPMHWRPVGKREFGECCHPVNYKDPSQWGTVSLDDSDEWKPLPAAFDAPSTEAAITDTVPLGTISECPSCEGSGKGEQTFPAKTSVPCWRCGGSGRVMAYRETPEQFKTRMGKVQDFVAGCQPSAPINAVVEQAPHMDTVRMDWLEQHVVEVRVPLVYGSRHRFYASPGEETPSDIRQQIDAAIGFPALPSHGGHKT